MERAVPATMLIAASTLAALRSGIFSSAISLNLRLGDVGHLVAVGTTGSVLQTAGLLDQNGGRGSLGDEGERTVLINGNNYRDDQTDLLGRTVVELLAEAGDVHAVLTQRRDR